MPDVQRLAAWLDLPCRACDEPFSAHLNGQHPSPTGSSIRAYQSPDPKDGRTMIAILDALTKEGYEIETKSTADVSRCIIKRPNRFVVEAARTLPKAVEMAATTLMAAVMEATDD